MVLTDPEPGGVLAERQESADLLRISVLDQQGAVFTSLYHVEKVPVVMLVYDELASLHLLFEHGVNHVAQLRLVQGFEEETSLNSVLQSRPLLV